MQLTLNLSKNQTEQLKEALLLLERKKDLFGDEDYQNLIEQVYIKEGLDE